MAKDRCQPIRDAIDQVEQEIQDLQELLKESTPTMKPSIIAQIKREKQHLTQLKTALRLCLQHP